MIDDKRHLIALVVILGFFTMCFTLVFKTLDNADHDVLCILMGQLSAAFGYVLSYYFGDMIK